MDVRLARRYFNELLCAIGCMHSIGIAHRDIKPENLLICTDVRTGHDRLVVTDFGFATRFILNGRARRSTTKCGTRPYLAPEVPTQPHYDPAPADVWSCGCVLYAMLVGQIPWTEATTVCTYFNRYVKCRNENKMPDYSPWTQLEAGAKSERALKVVPLYTHARLQNCSAASS
jgi:serine/threonine-protein kinase Chk1